MADLHPIDQFDLRSLLRFNFETGHIWLDENRMMLVHVRAFAAMRRELLETLGPRRGRSLLLRMGYLAGQQDADLALKLCRDDANYDVFQVGPDLHALEGVVKAAIRTADIDWEKGTFFGEVDWRGSWEAEAQLQSSGLDEEPACWTLVGYASGYTSRFFRRFIVFRETQCVCRGDEKCVIVGKPAEAWNDPAYVDYFRQEGGGAPLGELEDELAKLRGRARDPLPRGQLIGNAPAFRSAFDLLGRAAPSPITVLLLGETGVGKEMFARWLHEHGERASEAFVAINCAAIPHELIESELFGVQRGAFTGAQQTRAGRFERADGGTLFLDELGDLSMAAQAKLLRVLQTGEVERLGGDQVRKVNVRLIAATNVNLEAAIAGGRFRADLYYRLATFPVTLPPLRERRTDIPLLAQAFLEKFERVYQKHLRGFSGRSIEGLKGHAWPGNVRELENVVERGVLLADFGGQVELEHLFPGVPASDVSMESELSASGQVRGKGRDALDRVCKDLLESEFDLEAFEARLIEVAVRRAGGNLTHAAKALGMTRRQLAYRVKQTRPRAI